ncbi:MAG: murein transglycosylase A [Pseudomonadota bacterium]
MGLAACQVAPPPDRLTLRPAAFDDLPGWTADRHGEGLVALKRSCARLSLLPGEAAVGGAAGEAGDWREACAAAELVPAADHAAARAFFERHFLPFGAANGDRMTGLFTGYFEPELRGARRPGGRYSVPLYARPADLVTVDLGRFRDDLKGQRIAGRIEGGSLMPYPSRAEIEAGALAGRAAPGEPGLEIVWVDDRIDAFFLHIQGSGRVVLEDGRVLRIGYAANNGHPYVAIGRDLVAMGALAREEVSMQSIAAWLRANPERAAWLMNKNPSFVFFRALDGDGPLGTEGVVLTPGRSLAVDPAFVPMGLPLWLDAVDPLAGPARLRRLVVAQDTGSAIRGPVRGDLFWGHGPEAAERAGRMRSEGRYWLLIPRQVAERLVRRLAQAARDGPLP